MATAAMQDMVAFLLAVVNFIHPRQRPQLIGFDMKYFAFSILLVGSIGATVALAAVPSDAPSGTMGMCKDGTYSSAAEKKGACRGHKGVKEWYGESMAAEASKPKSQQAPDARPPTTARAPTTAPANLPAVAGTSGTAMTPSAGGGAGKVWANTSTKVYHCPGNKFYGATKQGDYMTEADAKAKGYHADHGKACG